jgi:hypothetical protein
MGAGQHQGGYFMSIKAHRIIEIKFAENPSFKLWDNSKLMQLLEEEIDFSNNLNSSGTGELEISLKVLKKLIKMSARLDIDEETIRRLQEDIDFAKSRNNDYVIYECF